MARRWMVGGILLVVASAGCSSSAPPAPAAKAPRASGTSLDDEEGQSAPLVAAVTSVHEGQKISNEEALAFGREMEAAIASGDAAAYSALFDWDAFGEIALGFLPQETNRQKSYRAGAFSGLKSSAPRLALNWHKSLPTAAIRCFICGSPMTDHDSSFEWSVPMGD